MGLALFGCGNVGSPASPAAAAGSSGTAGGQSSAAGAGGQSSNTQGGSNSGGAPVQVPATPAQACRDYFTAVCTRTRECGAPKFRPCESPIDLCPDILLADGSNWSVDQIVSCTAAWKTQSCDDLMVDQGPACSYVLGNRPVGDDCAFDVQCKTGACGGGIVPFYEAICGKCIDIAPSHGACSVDARCPPNQVCNSGTCTDYVGMLQDPCDAIKCPEPQTCASGACVAPPGVGGACSSRTKCAAGLGCQIELVSPGVNEPGEGVCQPLPPIGDPCLPTFGSVGACVSGGTCDGRPTGKCVPLVEVGGTCGFTRCVDGAYCQVEGYDFPPPYICYERGGAGADCDLDSPDHGAAACADGFLCVCANPPCDQHGACQAAPGACARITAFGRDQTSCGKNLATNLECLCTTPECTDALCAEPRTLGQSCDGKKQICRQGLTCNGGVCAELTTRNLAAQVCAAQAP